MDDLPRLRFASQADWAAWLEQHCRDRAGGGTGAWLQFAKKGNPEPSVTYAEALDVALCFGWIDGQKAGLDDAWWLQRFTPRRPSSRWSEINRKRAQELLDEGRMTPAGAAEVERAKADGRWDAAYAGSATIEVPPDLAAALERDPAAAVFFETLNSANRYAILYRLHDAKKPETRARRLGQFLEMLREGRTIHPQSAGRRRSTGNQA